MGGDNQVIVLNHQIVNRRDRQVQLQRLPVGAVVEGYINAGFGPGIKQTFFPGINPNCPNIGSLRDPVYNRTPGFSEVVRLENVGFEVVQPMPIDRDICGVRVVR